MTQSLSDIQLLEKRVKEICRQKNNEKVEERPAKLCTSCSQFLLTLPEANNSESIRKKSSEFLTTRPIIRILLGKSL